MYYVYVDETDDQIPFYVGKGSSNRIKRLTRNRKHTRVAKKYGQNRIVLIETEDEAEAFEYEKAFIAELHTYVYDSAAEHLACNFTTGGDGTSGHRDSEEVRQKKRECRLGEKNPAYGTHINAGEKNWMFGRTHTPEAKQKISVRLKGISHPQTEETRRKIGASKIGKSRSEETKRKVRDGVIRYYAKLREEKKNGVHER
ncbi:MAG: hypothetical protein KGL39_47445 [Patescibacteria group bacterium]|nr:hypothetical protein [Patescibacteria group bacterium]